MYSNFKEQAIEYIKQAVQEDNAGNYVKAFPLYMNALEYFKTHLKYEKNPKIKEAITQKFTEYLRRAEEIRAVLDEGGPSPGPNGDAAVAVKPKSKGKGGGGDGDDDPEKEKLRAGLNSAIIREKPNVQWNDVAGLESAKQALQEAVILPVKYPQFFTGKMETSTESPTPTNLEDTTLGGASSIQSNTIGETIAKDKDEKNDVEAADGGENKSGIEKTQVDMRQYALRNARSVDGKLHISNYVFDQEKARSDLARMIIMHEYPFSIVDHIGFIEFCQSLQPAFTPVSRNTIKCDIMKIFHVEKVSLMKLLDKNKSRIAITSDMWTASNQKKGYMVVTAHFIDDSWVLQSRIMRFIYVPCPHTSDVLAECLVTCFLDWNIDRKLSTITLDNCSTNDKIMDILKDRLRKSSLMLNGDMIHMRCCAHILNLIVQDGLSVINEQIIRIRDSVSFWTATPKRLEKFEIAAKQLEISCSKKLILDCKTRWNSTYTMLIIALAYKDVFPRLQQRETLYKCLPTDKDWELAKEICDRLKIFYDVTKLFSGSQYPTANIYFPQICEIRLALSKWVVSDISVVSEMANKMVTKYEKYWSMIHGIMGIAAVFDPRYKFALLEFYYDDIFGENAEEEINKIRSLCYKFLNEYELKEKMVSRSGKNNSSSSSHSQATQSGSIEGSFTSLQRFDEYLNRKISKANTKSELDRYLEEPMLPISDSFDILAWWKTTGIRYPIMQMIARDIYAIPISTVASESAFSTSGRLISPHRSRLHPTTLEALMCCQSWFTASSSKHGVIPNMDNDSDTDEGVGNNDQKVLVLAATNTPYALDQL